MKYNKNEENLCVESKGCSIMGMGMMIKPLKLELVIWVYEKSKISIICYI